MHCIWLLGWKIYGHFSFLNGNPKTINFNYWWIFLKQNRGRYIIHCQVHHISGEHNKGQSQDIKGQLGEKKGSCEAYLSDNLSPNKMEFQWWTLPFGLWRFILTSRMFLPIILFITLKPICPSKIELRQIQSLKMELWV